MPIHKWIWDIWLSNCMDHSLPPSCTLRNAFYKDFISYKNYNALKEKNSKKSEEILLEREHGINLNRWGHIESWILKRFFKISSLNIWQGYVLVCKWHCMWICWDVGKYEISFHFSWKDFNRKYIFSPHAKIFEGYAQSALQTPLR